MKSRISQENANESLLAIHGISAAFVSMLVMGHVYLSLVAIPRTEKVLLNGKVYKKWADHHHPNWNTNSKNK